MAKQRRDENWENNEDARVQTSKVTDDTDIFAEIAGTPKAKELREIIEDDEGDDDKDDEEEEDEEEDDEPEEKPGKKKTAARAVKEAKEESEEGMEKKKDEEEEENGNDGEEEPEEVEEKDDIDVDKDAKEEIVEAELEENGDEEDADEEEDEEKNEEDEFLGEEPKKNLPSKRDIRNTILEKASLADATPIPVGEKLEFLNDKDKKSVFIGTKASIFKKYGYDAALHIGRVQEEEFKDWEVYLDSMNPHVVFVCGARGSGKSYVLGVIAEELAEKNKNVGIIVVDPIGVFWSMRYPNREEKELEKLIEWGLAPKGLNNMKVFVPEGIKKDVPKSTYDSGFSILPSLLTGEDWALTFKVDRFSVSGLLLEKVLKKTEKGYKQMETGKKIPGKGKNYSLDDLIECLETDVELNGKERGYKPDSIRAISSRFEAAKTWGIFSEKGTPLGQLSRENQLTVLDTSFLEDNVTALVIGILARRLLAARKISTRKEAASQFKSLNMNELLELEVPPTWLFIDEAHTLIPSGNEVTPATAGLIEYVKQGRRPGLSLVFATQQPSAINTKVLSQLDVIMSHKLIFDDDIKAVFKRTPTIMPKKYRFPNFIKTLPVGVAVTGDRREETSRAFVMGIRPRKSQHEGRDAETSMVMESLTPEQVERLAVEMLAKDVKAQDIVEIEKAELALGTLNNKYGTKVNMEDVLEQLKDKGFAVTEDAIMVAGYTQEKVVDEIVAAEEKDTDEESVEGEETSNEGNAQEASQEDGSEAGKTRTVDAAHPMELLSLPKRIDEDQARRIAEAIKKKRLFGLLGSPERIESIQTKYFPIWRIKFDVMTARKEFISKECFINSLTGEFIHFTNGNFIESKGLRLMSELNEEEANVLKMLQRKELLIEEIMAQAEMDEGHARRILQKLIEKGVIARLTDKKSEKQVYFAKDKLDLPPNERHDLLESLARLPFVKAQALSLERERITKNQAEDSLKKLWPSVVVKKTEILHKPVWHIVLSQDAKERSILIDAVNGKLLTS